MLHRKQQLTRQASQVIRGFVEIEVLLAITMLAGFVLAMSGSFIYAEQSIVLAGSKNRASMIANGAIESVRNIRNGGWNELIFDQSAVEISGGSYIFSGEGTDEVIGDYTRTIIFDDVCRDASDVITLCPGVYIDIETKKMTVTVEWTSILKASQSISRSVYLTNWEATDWVQTDWSGGDGQSIWSDATMYESDDSNLDYATSGMVTLSNLGGGVCSGKIWDFDTSTNYTFDPAYIEISSSYAQLVNTSGGSITTLTSIDNYEYNTSNGETPTMVHISGDIYAIAHEGVGSDGWVYTVEISTTGIITKSVIDTFEFDTKRGVTPHIIHISGDIYAIAYSGNRTDGWLATIEIDSGGNITGSTIDTFEFDTNTGITPYIQHVGGDYFAISYTGPGNDGWLKTVEISSTGSITNSTIDSFEFDTSNGYTPMIATVSGDIFVIAYRGTGDVGELITVDIDSSGNIDPTIVDSETFDSSGAYSPDIINISGDFFGIVYEDSSSAGVISTYEISSVGAITSGAVSTLIFDSDCGAPDIEYVSGDLYILAYEGSSRDGFASFLEIDSTGIISSVIDVLEYDTSNGEDPFLMQLQDEYFVIAYDGSGVDGFIQTINLGSGTSPYPSGVFEIYPNNSYTESNVDQWTSFTEVAEKNSGEIYYQLSDDDGVTWYYWNGTSWTTAGTSNYNTADVINSNISDFPATTKTISFKAFLEGDGTQFVRLDSVSFDCALLQVEVGQVDIDDNWTTVTTINEYTNPIVVASYFESLNTLPASVRIRNVSSNSFDIRLQHPGGTTLNIDEITYIVSERGKWTLDGVDFEADSYNSNTVAYKGNWVGDLINFKHTYSANPVVLHTVITENDSDWIASWVSKSGDSLNPPSVSSMDIALNASEVSASNAHSEETIGYIVFSSGLATTFNSLLFETQQTPDNVRGHDNGCYTYTYNNTYSDTPVTLVAQQQMDGGDGGWGVVCSNSTTAIGMHNEEDQEGDSERAHTTEIFSFVTFESNFSYSSLSSSGFSTSGYLVSSAYDMGDVSAIQIFEWDEDVTSCDPDCDIECEIRAAPDNSGSPGTWTDWYGSGGALTVFTDPDGTLISTDVNGNQWMQYQCTLTGDGSNTPILQEVRVNYR